MYYPRGYLASKWCLAISLGRVVPPLSFFPSDIMCGAQGCVWMRFLGTHKPPGREQWAPVSWSKQVPFTPGAHLAQSSEPAAGRCLCPASSCLHRLHSLDVVWVHPQALQAAGHRDHSPVHLVQKESSLTPSWVLLFKAICYVFKWYTKSSSIHTFYHIKQEVTVMKHSKVVRKKCIDFQGKKLKISTGRHFPSLLSFRDFTWLVSILPTASNRKKNLHPNLNGKIPLSLTDGMNM